MRVFIFLFKGGKMSELCEGCGALLVSRAPQKTGTFDGRILYGETEKECSNSNCGKKQKVQRK